MIQRSEPANYERAARSWLAMLCQERRSELDLLSLAQAAAALDALPSRRPAACAALPRPVRDLLDRTDRRL